MKCVHAIGAFGRLRVRTCRGAAATLLAAAGLTSSARADIWSWNTGNGFWMTANNWLPNSAPGTSGIAQYRVRIGDLPGVQNSTVWMNHDVFSGAIGFDELQIRSGMTLDMNGREGGRFGADISLEDDGSRLIVRASSGPNFYDLYASTISVGAGSQLVMADNGSILTGLIVSSGVISGWGTVTTSTNSLRSVSNNGVIVGSSNGPTFVQGNQGRFDLDGTGGGQLNMTAPFSQLTFQGEALTDSFSGTVTMGSGSLLTMNMSDGWSADASSTFNVSSSIVGAAAQIDGGHFTFGGDLNIGGSHGNLRLLADSTFTSTADVFLGTNDRLEFDGSATVQGGLYNVSSGGRIDFDGPTQIGGGTFNLVGSTPAQGAVNFNGSTTWSGTTTINGFARQVGDATVSTPTTINATVLDMDGTNSTAWTINHSLTVNTQAIEQGSQQFDGTLNMNAGAVGRLTINLADPAASWTMDGTMNLAGLGMLTTTRVAGSRMIVTGDLNMGAGIAQITADTALQGADVNINAAGTLRMRGMTTVDSNTQFSGTGILHNGIGGTMVFDAPAALAGVGLLNSGVLSVGGDGPGGIGMDRVAFTAESLWQVGIGGYAALQNDRMKVTGASGASLGGTLSVSLLDLGIGFIPQVGDEWMILFSVQGGNTGAFINDPVTLAGDHTYEWSLRYTSHHVYLRLDNIVPSPGSVALLGLGGVLAARRRRS